MEWVETTGRTVEEARDVALDELGVDEDDAEVVVLVEPKVGLFGRVRQEARIRARVRPQAPPPKVERRARRTKPSDRPKASAGRAQEDTQASPAVKTSRTSKTSRTKERSPSGAAQAPSEAPMTDTPTDLPSWEEQATLAREFVGGLTEAFELEAVVRSVEGDDGGIEIKVDGSDLGLLVGPKGATLQAVQELSRIALQRYTVGASETRLRVDVGGYRQRRQEALARFVTQIAEQVRESGEAQALEPMNAADRKVVHDTVSDIDGVGTVSEGEDLRRHVVISPDDPGAE